MHVAAARSSFCRSAADGDRAARGADRGKIVSVLRLEGIIEKITMIIDDTVVCDNGKILV